MLGIADRMYTVSRQIKKYRDSIFDIRERQLIELEPEKKGNCTVVAFLPSVLMAGRYLGNRVLQSVRERGLGALALEIPATTVQATPRGTREMMDEAYEVISERVNQKRLEAEQIIVMGMSIGCCQASRFAAEYGTNRLVLALPGSKLTECIFDSYTTRGEKSEAERKGFQLADYREALRLYDPITYVPRISGRLALQMATHDLMIPSQRGFELLMAYESQTAVRNDLHVSARVYSYYDHSSGAFRFAREFGKIVDSLLA